MTATGGPLAAHRLVGDDRDRGVVAAVQTGLEQQRHLDDERPGRRVGALLLPAPGHHPRPHARPQQLLQPAPALLGGKRLAGEGPAIDGALGQNLGAEAVDDRVADVRRLVELVDHPVGRQAGGAQPLQGGQGRGFAGADAARQPDEGGMRDRSGRGRVRLGLLGVRGGAVDGVVRRRLRRGPRARGVGLGGGRARRRARRPRARRRRARAARRARQPRARRPAGSAAAGSARPRARRASGSATTWRGGLGLAQAPVERPPALRVRARPRPSTGRRRTRPPTGRARARRRATSLRRPRPAARSAGPAGPGPRRA